MAEQKRRKFPQFTSPKGTFKYPKLSEPDYGTKEYPCPQGRYGLKLVMPAKAPETKAFIKALTPAYEEALAEAKEAFEKLPVATRKKLGEVKPNPLFTEVYDKETEQPTGDIEFNIKMDASGEYKKGPKAGTKWTAKPVLFDASGQRMVRPPAIWSGTEGKVAFEARPYFVNGSGAAGLSFKLIGVQIVKLVSAGERSADSLGFGAEEGGYAYHDEAFSDDSQGTASTSSDNTTSGDF